MPEPELRSCDPRIGKIRDGSGHFLRPNPLLVLVPAGSRRLHGYWTSGFRLTAAFEDPSRDSKGLDLGLKSGNLRLKNRDLVFFLFYRVINIRHVVILASLGNRAG